ncbi:MAG: helix-turn-helix domain-containing protein [Methanomassiliicoccales archaeon]|nr:helix-turn-helix domain-containing protein [Methanomassiliicoccales archaeon]
MKTNVDEDRLSDILIQLSNADRRRIIEVLQTKKLKLNEVAKELDITATEAFRQLQRLTDAGLLEKTSDGRYRSTPYSRLIQESSTAMDFLSKHREYFLDHDTSLIPPQFRARFGELSKTVLHTEAVPNINTGSEVLKSAEERIDVIGEHRLEQHVQIAKQRSLEGVKVRTLLQESNIESMKEEIISVKQSLERRFIPRVCAVMIMTEKIVGIALPRLDGKMDYQVFAGNDSESMRWASDLFEDQWNKAKPWHP